MPHCMPSYAVAATARRCSSHLGWSGSGLAIQKLSTAGCIADTSATDESAAASVRSTPHSGRAVWAAEVHMPPWSRGTIARRSPASASAAKSSCSR